MTFIYFFSHIVMGLTQCGQFLLTYTFTVEVTNTSLYKYLLHWWAFTPNRVARKVAEVTLFGNYTIYRELNIVISQWPMERNKLVIHGLWYVEKKKKANYSRERSERDTRETDASSYVLQYKFLTLTSD